MDSAVSAALIRSGNRDLQLSAIDKSLVRELRDFLQPFKCITNMISGRIAHIGYVTLIRHEILTLCTTTIPGESFHLKELKRLVLANLDRRLPQNSITTLATLLDPGTKEAIDLSRDEKVSLTFINNDF